jgi:hypothetical protein
MRPMASLVVTLSAVRASPTSGTNESTNTTAATRTNVLSGVADRRVSTPCVARTPVTCAHCRYDGLEERGQESMPNIE